MAEAAKKEQQTRLPDTKQRIEELVEKSKISLWIDDYTEIFSDFDPRPFSQRALSDDFLNEAKKVARETKRGELELNFLVPADKRNTHDETTIKRRMREYFKSQAKYFEDQTRKDVRKGGMLVAVGFLMMIISAYIYFMEPSAFIFYSLIVIFEPAGWFSVWYGLDMILYFSREKKPDMAFNQKMAKAEISFDSY